MDRPKLLIAGAGGFGRVVLEHAVKEYDCAFLDDGPETGASVNGTPVIGRIGDLAKLYGEYELLLVAIGNNALRQKIYTAASIAGYRFPNILAENVYVSPYAHIGSGCVLLNNVVVQNNAFLGDGSILNPGVELHHDSSVGAYSLIYGNSVIRSLAKIGERVKIGSTLTIGNGVIIEDDSVIEDGQSIL